MNQSRSALGQQRYAVFFVSTGRCATQWFAQTLDEHFQDIARVRHEPFHEEYEARYHYNAYKSGLKVELSQTLKAHLESIAATLANKHYIETGWPSYGMLPTMIERFDGRIKIVHLYRHPIAVASSLLTHNVYRRGEWTKALAISPSDRGVRQPELEKNWESMSQFEKCLFWWTEINAWALGLHAEFPEVPWLSLKFEDVFGPNGDESLKGLLNFLNFPINEAFLNTRIKKVDRFQSNTSDQRYWDISTEFSETASLSNRLGYQLQSFDKDQLRSRYDESKWFALPKRYAWRISRRLKKGRTRSL